MKEKNCTLLKRQSIILISLIICVLVLIVISFQIGKSVAVDTAAVNKLYETKITQDSKLVETINILTAKEPILQELEQYEKTRDEKNKEIESLSTKLSDLTSQVEAKQNELNQLTGSIDAIKSEKTFTAGMYTVGTDLSPGKYDVQWVSGQGNFWAGDNVREIFSGRDDFGIKEYKNMKVKAGDEIEIKGSLKVKLLLKE